MLTPFGYFDLIDVMEQPGCPVCNLLARDIKKLLNTMLYESVTEPEMHEILRASRGLCNVHGWQLSELSNVMSIAILYKAVLDEILKELDRAKLPQRRMRGLFKSDTSPVSDALAPKEPCFACQKRDEYQESYITVFSDHLTDERLIAPYRESDGLCIDHFKQVLNHTSNRDAAQQFVEIQRHIWEKLHYDLSEFTRKYDYTNAHEAMGAEGNSWFRTIRQLTGGKGVFGFRQKDRS